MPEDGDTDIIPFTQKQYENVIPNDVLNQISLLEKELPKYLTAPGSKIAKYGRYGGRTGVSRMVVFTNPDTQESISFEARDPVFGLTKTEIDSALSEHNMFQDVTDLVYMNVREKKSIWVSWEAFKVQYSYNRRMEPNIYLHTYNVTDRHLQWWEKNPLSTGDGKSVFSTKEDIESILTALSGSKLDEERTAKALASFIGSGLNEEVSPHEYELLKLRSYRPPSHSTQDDPKEIT